MHQTFYIDIDEEITSVVDRLRKAKATEVIIVVPKRALLIQSIVNLKLLKKEADNLKKEIIIVTQDSFGKTLVEKTGIAVEQKIDDIDGEEMMSAGVNSRTQPMNVEIKNHQEESSLDVRKRVDNMGSDEYFEEAAPENKLKIRPEIGQFEESRQEPMIPESALRTLSSEAGEKIINEELVTGAGTKIKTNTKRKKSGMFDIGRNVKNIDIQSDGMQDAAEIAVKNEAAANSNIASFMQNRRQYQGEKYEQPKKEKLFPGAEDFRQSPYLDFPSMPPEKNMRKDHGRKEAADFGKVNLSGKFWKYFAILGAIAALFVIGAAAYLFLPKADIKIFVKTDSHSIDAQVKGDVNQASVDIGNELIPAKLVSVSDQAVENYPVTGSATASGQKARGTITIYNEFSSSPQALVATTRFETADGKVFRLTKTVSVPGMTTAGGKTTPGAIEAEVVADGSGDSYNIDPTTFTIPGFKDSGDKYSKFYAKSFKPMTGGGSGGNTAKAITATDITNAKSKTLSDLTDSLKKKLQDSAGGEKILDDAINASDATYSVSNSEGEVVNNFTVTVNATVSALAFNEKDLKDILEKDLSKATSDTNQIDENSLNLQYGKSDVDFTAKTITIRVNASGKTNSGIDLENLKKGVLGKTEDEFKAYLKNYPTIDRAEINYWPSFLTGKIPAYESRVTIELDNN